VPMQAVVVRRLKRKAVVKKTRNTRASMRMLYT